MSARVCQGGRNANTPEGERVAIDPEDMEKAVYFGLVPDELVEAGRPSVTQDEMRHFCADDLALEMSYGLTAWRAIAFALQRGLPLPRWVLRYLADSAASIENWAMQNTHPGDLKELLALGGQRFYRSDKNDPRWIYQAICQLRESEPEASVKSLVLKYLKEFPQAGGNPEERVRQKYYQGKRLAEKGEDYKGRARKRELWSSPAIAPADDLHEPDF